MAERIAGFFHTREAGRGAERDLLLSGFPREGVSFVAGDGPAHAAPAVGPLESIGAESEAGQDAFIGGAAGFAAGMIAAVLPGIGPLIAAGPLAGAIGGLTVGAAAGGIIGLLRDHGISDEEAEFFAEGVRRGGALVTVDCRTPEQAHLAKKIFKDHSVIDVEDLAGEWGPEGRPRLEREKIGTRP